MDSGIFFLCMLDVTLQKAQRLLHKLITALLNIKKTLLQPLGQSLSLNFTGNKLFPSAFSDKSSYLFNMKWHDA